MRDLFQLDRPLSPGSVRTATRILGVVFAICAGLILLLGLLTIFWSGGAEAIGVTAVGLLQIGLGVGVLLALYMLVRLLGEILMALHRQNDRLGILSDELSSVRTAPKTPPAAPRSKPAKKPTKKPSAEKTAE